MCEEGVEQGTTTALMVTQGLESRMSFALRDGSGSEYIIIITFISVVILWVCSTVQCLHS